MALWSHYVAVEVLTADARGEAPVDHSRGRAGPGPRALTGLTLAAIAAVILLAGASSGSPGTVDGGASASSPTSSPEDPQFPTGPYHGRVAVGPSVADG